jgi:hypothetical protein
MITLEDALDTHVKTFYHRFQTYAMSDGDPVRAVRRGKTKVWKKTNQFAIPMGIVVYRLTPNDPAGWINPFYITNSECQAYGGRYCKYQFSTPGLPHYHSHKSYNNPNNWYTFDWTKLGLADLLSFFRTLDDTGVPKEVTKYPLEQMHDWLVEHGNPLSYTTSKYLQAKRDGITIPEIP